MSPEQSPSAIETLRAMHGNVAPPPANGPLELIIWKNIAYLADTDRRGRAFDLLRSTVETSPEAILAATDDALLALWQESSTQCFVCMRSSAWTHRSCIVGRILAGIGQCVAKWTGSSACSI